MNALHQESRQCLKHILYLFLQAHNRNLLSIDFDHITRTGKIYDDHRKFTLRILYDQTGRPILWSPVSRYNEVNITYSPSGLVTFIQRGTWNEKMEYDQSGKIISRTWADGKIWSYTYLEKVSMWGRMDDNIESGSNYPR